MGIEVWRGTPSGWSERIAALQSISRASDADLTAARNCGNVQAAEVAYKLLCQACRELYLTWGELGSNSSGHVDLQNYGIEKKRAAKAKKIEAVKAWRSLKEKSHA